MSKVKEGEGDGEGERELGFKPESHGPRVLVLPTMLHYLPLWILLCAPKTEGRVGLTVTFYPDGLLRCPQGLREE